MRKINGLRKGVLFTLLLLFSVHFGTLAQNVSVSGQVLDATGFSLPGVNIIVAGTSTGTITDIDGNYSIEAPGDAVLLFNYVGFRSQEIPVNGRPLINVVLEEDLLSLSEVVVVGYGTQRREAVTGSVATVRGDQLREVASANVTQALQGRVSGVEMSQVSSKPGAEMQIRVRGTRSLNASNDPLIVLDGIPFAGKIGDISPSDIKSLDILKDASATAIYGSRGANGVILITTNKGNKGQAARVTYNAYTGVKTLFNEYPMMNSSELTELRQASREYFGEGYRWYDLIRTQKWEELAGTYQIAGSDRLDNEPQTITRTIEKHHYLRPIPQGQIDGLEMTVAEKAAYQNPGYN